ncbi:MAG: hypothetical protein HQ461_07200, partial [Deltaproteobacteria bacterium]|nr:hypothetical protein [Deltaproteobacteria bacterium]
TDADCDTAAGEVCANIDEATSEGTCEAPADGSGSGSGSGADTCATDEDCADGEQCDNSACGAIVYQHVAIVSLASADLGTPNGTPGPDLDAVAVVSGGVPSFATSAPVLILGGFSVGKPNENATKADILGPNDVLTDTSGLDCIDPDGHSEFLSLGYKADPQGLVVLAMPSPISATDTISVYEVGNDYCRDITTTRDDAYDVYVGPRDIDAAAINDLNSLSAQGFIKLGGNSGQIGKIFNISAENIAPAQ